jgi:hypothetical protein
MPLPDAPQDFDTLLNISSSFETRFEICPASAVGSLRKALPTIGIQARE